MKRIYLFLLFTLCNLYLYAQSDLTLHVNKEGKLIVIPRELHYELNIPPYSYNTYTPASSLNTRYQLESFIPEIQSPTMDERPMDMQILSGAYRPFFNIYAPMLRKVSPMAFDFEETSITPINENMAFAMIGSQYTWPGAGGVTMINPMLVWNQDRWTITGGAFAGRFFSPFNSSPGYLTGTNLQVRYEATDWLALKAWGEYAYFWDDEKNPYLLANPFINQTSVGGAMEFKINENVGVGVGVNYEYNPHRRKMEPQYLLYPFSSRSSRFKIGIR